MDQPADSLPARMLRWLARMIWRHPLWLSYPQIFLFGLCVWYTTTNLKFSTNRNDLVGADKKYHQTFLKFREEFPGQDDLVALIESEDVEKNRQFVERLGMRVEKETNLFTDVFYKGDLKMMGPKALLFLPEQTLDELKGTLESYRPFIDQFAQATNLNSLFRLVNQRFRTARRETNAENQSLVKALPALTRILTQANASLDRPGNPPSPGITALFDGGVEAEQRQYITFAHGRIYLVSARAARDELEGEAVERLRELVRITQGEVPGVNVGITGEPILEFDEMRQSQADSTRASIISLIVCALIFIVGYREVNRPLKATAALIIGLGYTMAYTVAVVGRLNILTVTFFPILIGMAIDFGVHLISRFEEELQKGTDQEKALERAMTNTGLGVFTGCLTTAGAFFAMALTDFKGIQEMGIITGGGMIVCLLPMLTFLPATILNHDRPPQTAPPAHRAGARERLENLWLHRPVASLVIAILLCGISVSQFPRLSFDYNLLNMQSKGLPAVVFERKLIDSASKSVLYAAVVTDSLEDAQRLEAAITNLPTVASVDSMTRFLAEKPDDKLRRIGEIKEILRSVDFAETDVMPASLNDLDETLRFTSSYLALALAAGAKDEAELERDLEALRAAIRELRQRIALAENPDRMSRKLGAYQKALFNDVHQTFAALKTQDDRAGIRPEDLPQALRNRFIGKTGKHLLQVYPKENIWQRDHQEAFVKELRTVDPDVTNTPVQLYEYTTLLKDSYQTAAYYALGAIALMVLIHFRSIRDVILSLIPVLIGSIWTAGAMGALGIPFNPANIMTLPLVIGIGVTNGIHILNRFAEEHTPSILGKSTGKAVIVSAMTTIAGFGSLIPAKHQGIASLGLVMSIGVGACMIAALTCLPALLNLFGGQKKKPGANNAQAGARPEEPR